MGHDDSADEFDLVVWFAPTAPTDREAATAAVIESMLLAQRAKPVLERAASGGRAAFLAVTQFDGAFGLTEVAADEKAILGGVFALVKTLGIEGPTLFCRGIDIAVEQGAERGAAALLAELYDPRTELTQVGYGAAGQRRTLEFTEDPPGLLIDAPEVPEPNSADLLVFTGGGRGVTAACAVAVAERFGCGLLLLGRTEVTDEPEWAAGIPDADLMKAAAAHSKTTGTSATPRELRDICGRVLAQREIRATLEQVRAHGAEVEYLPVDVSDPAAVRAALAPYRDRITGIVHGAAVLDDQLIDGLTPEAISKVLTTKIRGWSALLDAVDADRLRHAVMFGSVAATFGNRGQASYSVANDALNHLACALKLRHPGIAVTSINWSALAGGMLRPELQKLLLLRGITPISLADGGALFAEQLTAARSRDVLCQIGPWPPAPLEQPDAIVVGREVRVSRDMRPIGESRALSDHMVDGYPVLPATVALGAILDVVKQTHPGLDIRSARDLKVLKGLVFDSPAPRLYFTIRDIEPTEVSVLVTDETNRPRYRATVSSVLPEGDSATTNRYTDLPPLTGGTPVTCYQDGTLFHGPSMQGLRTVLADDGERLILNARMPVPDWGGGYCGTDRYLPLTADVVAHGTALLSYMTTGVPSLPTGCVSTELVGSLPNAQPLYLVVHRPEVSLPLVRCTVEACDPDGRVLLRFRHIELVTSAALAEKFQAEKRPADV
ncbi:SDR family NAD(P)-dependent oxidoreductase [Nocardia terpenica]|uniref:Beta keto-acyl synthase n=1 Tax=Nocardia terpenica TaxID=455432 RepID=A0A291RM91_9NOCA|nr:SDR family NAD(P)-dependent oxidoreductase [Nocardia terpenica]ATL68202.1 beta keto-acyl synthase [Nocardia terpenica]